MEAVVARDNQDARAKWIEANGTHPVIRLSRVQIGPQGAREADDGLQEIVAEARVVERKDGEQGSDVAGSEGRVRDRAGTISLIQQGAQLGR